jgi:CRISPR-associated protein Csx1
MVSILISTWGDPKAWENVTYKIDGRLYPTPTKSSLPVILNYTSPKPERVFIIVLDTIVKHNVSSYKDLKDSVMAYYEEFLHSLDLDVPVEIIVAPGVGRFRLDDGSYAEFQGFLTDFQAYVTFEVVRRILELGGNELIIHLDLTHGVNFMPSLMYAIVCDVLGAFAIAKRVHLKVYNAEPYIRGVTTELNIHNVEDREFQPNIKNEALPFVSRLLELGIVPEREKGEVKNALYSMRVNEKDANELNAFLSSLINGLPLAYYTFYPEVNSLELLLSNAEKLWASQVKVYQTQTDILYKEAEQKSSEARVVAKKMVVERRARFRNEFTRCATILAVAKALNHKRKDEVKLDELKDLRQKVFSKWIKLNSMISFDLEEVEKIVQKYGLVIHTWARLGEVAKEYYTQPRENILIRNFLAHSGLERTLTYVKRQGKEIMLSYDPKKRETILKASLRGLYRGSMEKPQT